MISLDTRHNDAESSSKSDKNAATSMVATWRAHSAVGRTVTDDSFKGGWEDALYELIKNSIDADARRVRITCPATDLVPAEQRFVSVEDDGHGMTPEAVRDKFCVVGRAKKSHDGERSPGGRRLYGERGTGRLACFVVAGMIEVESTAQGKTSRFELTRAFVRSETPDASQKVSVAIAGSEVKRHGTRVTLKSFQHGLPMPTADAVGRWILRRFGEPSARIEINGKKFAPTSFGQEVARFDVEEIDGFGTVDGTLWLLHEAYRGDKKTDNKWQPGILLTMNGQHFFGPHLFDLAQGRPAVVRSTIRSLLGRIEIAPLDPELPQPNAWPSNEPYSVFLQWLTAKVDAIVRRHVDAIVTAKVDVWMSDPGIRRVFDRLDPRKKESAKRVLVRLAQQRVTDRAEVRILARMALRCVETSGIRTAADDLIASPSSSSAPSNGTTNGTTNGNASERDAWALRKAAEALSAVLYRERTLDELSARAADPSKGEGDLPRLIASNLWIIDEALTDYVLDEKARDAARSHLDVDPTDPESSRRALSLFALRDPSGKKLVLLDLRSDPIAAPQREELIRVARAISKVKGGFAFARVILLGASADARKPVGEAFEERTYSFEGATYGELCARARLKLAALRAPLAEEEAEILRLAQERNEAEIAELMGLTDTDDVMAEGGGGAQLSLGTTA